jgi:FkbM family methyltransferase
MNVTNFTYNNHHYKIRPVYSEKEHIFLRIHTAKTFYEINLLETVRKLNLSGTYIDAGANIGNHTLYFLNECASNKLIAIEPIKDFFGCMKENVLNNNFFNKSIDAYNIALGDKKCNVSFSQINKRNPADSKVESEGGDIPCTTLDSLLTSHQDISLIKIDTEGYELKILHGSVAIIKACYPVIICEAADSKYKEDISSFLSNFGYTTDNKKLAGTPTFMWKHK